MIVYVVFNTVFEHHFSYITAASAPIHAFQEFLLLVLRKIFFPSHWLLSHLTIAETVVGGEKGMNHVEMTIINPWKEYWPSRGSHQQPHVLKSCTPPTELWGSAFSPKGALGLPSVRLLVCQSAVSFFQTFSLNACRY